MRWTGAEVPYGYPATLSPSYKEAEPTKKRVRAVREREESIDASESRDARGPRAKCDEVSRCDFFGVEYASNKRVRVRRTEPRMKMRVRRTIRDEYGVLFGIRVRRTYSRSSREMYGVHSE